MSADSTPLEQEGESLQESPTSAMFPVTTPLTSTPLTSTPVLTSQLQLQVSQRRVTMTDRKALDGIADIYARLISGQSEYRVIAFGNFLPHGDIQHIG